MDYHEMYNELTLKYIIECRQCAGSGGSEGPDPCPVCLGSCVEGVSASDKIIEDDVLTSYRHNEFKFNQDFENLEMEV